MKQTDVSTKHGRSGSIRLYPQIRETQVSLFSQLSLVFNNPLNLKAMQTPSSTLLTSRIDQLNAEIEQLQKSRNEIATKMTNVMLWGKQAASYSPTQVLKVYMENRMKAASVKDLMNEPQMEQIIGPLKLKDVIGEYEQNAKAAIEYLADMVKVQEFCDIIKELEDLRRHVYSMLTEALNEEDLAATKRFVNTGTLPWE